jgi:hypothetical protein
MKLRRADIAFIVLIPVVLLCLWLLTTEQTTLRIPRDGDHSESLQTYRTGGKKEAERVCRTCHGDKGIPLSETHPPKYRCMFCHKPTDIGSNVPSGVMGNRTEQRQASDREKGAS